MSPIVAPLLVENWLIQKIKGTFWTSTKTWEAAKLPRFTSLVQAVWLAPHVGGFPAIGIPWE